MRDRLPGLHARLRGHVKNHKSPHIARLQLEHGAFGLCAATVWEAIVMVRAGADDVLDNSGPRSAIEPQVARLDRHYRALAARARETR